MDGIRFDKLLRDLTRSRRAYLRSALVLLPGWHWAPIAEGKKGKKRKKKEKKAKPNAFGCLNVGQPCNGDSTQCCSGICEGKKGKRTCRAHDTGSCSAGAHSDICGGTDVACTSSFGQPGQCATTTGNAGYCQAAKRCHVCTTDVECQEANGGLFGPYAACIHCAADCPETGGTACSGPFDLG